MTDSTGDSAGNYFTSVDLDANDVDLGTLHARVLGSFGRIELLRRGGACVLISRDELESLEKALEILSNTDTVRMMRQEIALLARVAAPDAPPVAIPANAAANAVANQRMRSLNLP